MIFNFGTFLNNHYIFLKQINSGAFSIIWLVYDVIKNNYCIAKILSGENKDIGENEINVLKKIKENLKNQPKTIADHLLLYDEIIILKDDIIIIEELQSLNLYDLIYKYYLSDDDKNYLINKLNQQIKPVLDFLKLKQILHTDIKPENIFIKIPGFHLDVKNKETILDFINAIQDIRCKSKQKNKNINKIINQFKDKFKIEELEETLTGEYEEETDEEAFLKPLDSMSRGEDILTDSDISSDCETLDNIDNFLNNKIKEYNNPQLPTKKIKKILDFNIQTLTFSIGDFGNAVDYSDQSNYNKILNTEFHDLQTRYYRHPNIIMRSPNILNSDYFAFGLTIEEFKKQEIIIEPFKCYGKTTDHEHLKLLIDANQQLECTKGRKTDLFFNFDPLTNKYYLGN